MLGGLWMVVFVVGLQEGLRGRIGVKNTHTMGISISMLALSSTSSTPDTDGFVHIATAEAKPRVQMAPAPPEIIEPITAEVPSRPVEEEQEHKYVHSTQIVSAYHSHIEGEPVDTEDSVAFVEENQKKQIEDQSASESEEEHIMRVRGVPLDTDSEDAVQKQAENAVRDLEDNAESNAMRMLGEDADNDDLEYFSDR